MHGKVLENAFLDLFQPVVVVVEHPLGIADRVVDLALSLPGQVDQRIDVVAHHRRFRRHGRHQLQFLELAIGLLARLLGHMRGDDLLLELFDVGAFLAFAQLLLNGLDLLIQVVVALAFLHLLFDAPADPLLDLQDVDLGFQLGQQPFQALGGHDDLEHLLFLLQLERQMRGDGVGQAAGVVDTGQRGQDLGRNLLVQLHILLELRDDGAAQRLGLRTLQGIGLDRRHLAGEMRIDVFDAVDAGALGALDQHLDGAVGQLEHLQDARHAADLIDVLGSRVILAGGLLRHQHDALARFHRHLQRADRARAADKQRNNHVRKHDNIAQRQQRQVNRVGRQGLTGRHRGFLGMTRRNGGRGKGRPRSPRRLRLIWEQ